MSSSRLTAGVCLFLFLTGCSKGPERPFETLAILPFEDLSSGGNGVIGQAVSSIAVERTQGDQKIRVSAASALREAQALRASQTLSGYYNVQNGTVVMTGELRDEAARRVIRTFEVKGPASDLAGLATKVAAETGAPVHDWPQSRNETIEAYFRARQAKTPTDALAEVDKAILQDPAFGPAHLFRAEMLLSTGRAEEALAEAQRAKASKLTDSDRARTDLLLAKLQNDRAGQVAAMSKLASIETRNLQLLRALVDANLVMRRYREAAEAADRVLDLQPDDEQTLNFRGYAHAFAGDLPAARKSFEAYAAAYPNSANPIDSLGEVLFYFGKYPEAADLFLQAQSKDPNAVNGSEFFRAALATWLANDPGKADALFRQYAETRAKLKDPALPMREAIWMRFTRRTPKIPQTTAGLAIASFWALQDGDRGRAVQLATNARQMAKTQGEGNLATTALIFAQPSASPQVWAQRINQVVPDPRQAPIRNELLGWSLLLDKHSAEAAEIWRKVLENSSPMSSNDQRILLAWSLAEAGQLSEARKIMPHGWLPPGNIEATPAILFYPKIVDIHTKISQTQ